ncbi:MAG TPA: hypothetical protein VM934_16485 [Pyrinomonadaceae bacterium]|nr:hypothetical protein [Pyrinomonadaceae bacterium]
MSRIDSINTQPARLEQFDEATLNAATAETGAETPVNFLTNVFELAFAATTLAARINRQMPPQPTPQTQNLASSGQGTETTYRIGDPARPPIRHDNGFLQNPNDRRDPKPIPTVAPSQADRDYYESELSRAKWAQRAIAVGADRVPFTPHELDLPDGIDAYRHFLDGGGKDRTFSYEKFVADDTSGRTILNNATGDTQKGVEDLYNQMIAQDPSLRGKPITFKITGGAITAGASNKFPYPDTENWQKAIGGHTIWTSATVTVKPPSTPGGRPEFSMNMTLHAEDRYNFNPGQSDIATGVPDATRGKLELTGLAHQYMNYATLRRDVTWTQGDIQGTTTSRTPGDR